MILARGRILAPVLLLAFLAGCSSGEPSASQPNDSSKGMLGEGAHGTLAPSPGAADLPAGEVPGSGPVAAGHNDSDVAFAQSMLVMSGQTGDLVKEASRSGSADLKALAATISAQEARELPVINGWLAGWKIPVAGPAAESLPGFISGADMTRLAAATGTDFDSLWYEMMSAHLDGEMVQAEGAASGGESAQVKAFAAAISSSRNGWIETMRTRMDALQN